MPSTTQHEWDCPALVLYRAPHREWTGKLKKAMKQDQACQSYTTWEFWVSKMIWSLCTNEPLWDLSTPSRLLSIPLLHRGWAPKNMSREGKGRGGTVVTPTCSKMEGVGKYMQHGGTGQNLRSGAFQAPLVLWLIRRHVEVSTVWINLCYFV